MKAIQISRFGGPEVLDYVEQPMPKPAPGQILLRVHAIGVNLADALMRANRYAVTPPLPAVPGGEAAGIVEAVGEGVSADFIGRRVVAALFATPSGLGAYADYVVIDAGLAIAVPDALSFENAVAILVQGLTALYLTRQASPKDKTVLITAAAGGVGGMLVQLCKAAGARTVIAGASTAEKLDLARSLGADIGINYLEQDWAEALRRATGGSGPDLIYESVGGTITATALQLLAPLGEIVIYGALNIQAFQLGVPELLGLIFKNQSVTGFAFAPLLTPEGMASAVAELFALVVAGKLKVTIGERYPLARAAEAHQAMEARRSHGKLILLP